MIVSNQVLIFETIWKSSHELYKTYVIFISSKSSIFCYHWSSEKINIIFCYNINWVKRWKEENMYIHIKYHTYIHIYIHNIHTWYTYVAGGFRVFKNDTKLLGLFHSGFLLRSWRLLFLRLCCLSYQVIDPKTKTTNIINTSLHNNLSTFTFKHYKINSTCIYIRYNIYKQE